MYWGKKTLLASAILIGLAGCNNSDEAVADNGLTLTIAHINDHHSKLDANTMAVTLDGTTVRNDIGGFAKLKTKFQELEANHQNLLKLHGGDAITGTMFYSLFKEELPDALMMNQICFDAFALGNHEFDDGNTSLAHFLDKLAEGDCGTKVLAANIEVPANDPLYGKYQAYQIFEFDQHKVGVIGIDISSKTQASSSPYPSTIFHDETKTAQRYIDKLKAQGVNKIILLTHQTYENDIEMAKLLTDVDVIVGGDSHTLLGHKERLNSVGFNPAGDYPTIINNADGHKTCIVQAWDNSKAVGELTIEFTASGEVKNCFGTPHILLGENFTTNDRTPKEIVGQERDALVQAISFIPELTITKEDPHTLALLNQYSEQINEKKQELIAISNDNLCNERVPQSNHASGALCSEGSPERDFINQHGSVMAQIVSQAFYKLSLRSDIAIQNTGGVRTSIAAGNVSVGDAFDVLPFSNFLVNLDMTGQEIINTIEDAIDNVVANNSSGAFPAAANLRYHVDMNAEKGQRVTQVEARRRYETNWHPINKDEIYVVVTNDFIAAGGDRYDSMVPVYEDKNRREDTGLLYTDSLINYFKTLGEKNQALSIPDASEMSLQHFVPLKN